MHKLRDKVNPKPTNVQYRVSKGVQTYMRVKEMKEQVPAVDKCGQQISRSKKRSPLKERSVRYKDNKLNETYDYLRSASSHQYTRSAEVRYLSDVTKCLKETIRQICEDRSVVCPQIQSRYSHHQRMHYKKHVSQEAKGIAIDPSSHKSSYCCKPCDKVTTELVPNTDTQESFDNIDGKLKRIVNEWLQSVPVYASMSLEAKMKREEILENLVNTIKQLKESHSDDVDDKIRYEIRKCMDSLPMWSPEDEHEVHKFKERLADNLFDKLRSLNVKSYEKCKKNEFDRDSDNFDKEIIKVLDKIEFESKDSQGQVIDIRKIKDILTKRLKSVVLGRHSNNNDYHDVLKNEITDILGELPLKIDGNKTVFIDNLADKLAEKLKNIPVSETKRAQPSKSVEDELQMQIFDWLKDIPESSGSASNIEENKKMVGKLAEKLHKLQMQGTDNKAIQQKMQDEIRDWLEFFTNTNRSYVDTESRNQLLKKLMEKLDGLEISLPEKISKKNIYIDDSQNNLRKQIGEWLEDIPELMNNDDTNGMIESLVRKLKDINDPDLLQNEITEWLNSAAQSNNPKNLMNLEDKYVNKIKSIETPKQSKSTSDYEEQITEDIWSSLKDILKTENNVENKNMVEQLAKKISKLQSQAEIDNGKKKVHDQIRYFLDNISDINDVNISNKHYLIGNIMSRIKATPKGRKRWNKVLDNGEQSKINEISAIFNEHDIKNGNSNKKDVENKTSNVIAKNIDKVKDGTTKQEPPSGISGISKMFMDLDKTKAVELPKSSKRSPISLNSKSSENDLKESIKEDISDIFDEYSIFMPNRDKIESRLANILANEIMRGKDNTREHIYQTLHDGKLSKEEVDDISKRLIEYAKELPLSFPKSDSTKSGSSFTQETFSPKEITPLQNEVYEDSIKKQIIDLIEEITGNSHNITKKNKVAIEQLSKKICGMVSDSKRTPDGNNNVVRSEVSKFLENLPIISKTPQALANKLRNRLQNVGFTTSTPRASVRREISLFPKRDTASLSSVNNDSAEKSFLSAKLQTNDEKQYKSELTNIVRKWIRGLEINLDGKNYFIETVVKNLVDDVIDRQKYIQLNPEAKVSEKEELEHLKYQVFRWLNKIINVITLSDIITKTSNLLRLINNVPVPQLVKSLGKRQEIKLAEGMIPNYLDALQDEISLWFGDVSSSLPMSTDSLHKQLIEELVENLAQLLRQENIEGKIDNEISKWVNKVIGNEIDEENLKKITTLLKNRLNNKGFIHDNSWILKQDNSQFIQENLLGSILDWLKGQSLYQNRNSQEKRIQENLTSELVKGLKDILESVDSLKEGVNTRLLKEIMKHLQKFPMEQDYKTNEEYIRNIAEKLLHHLKDLELFCNISDMDLRRTDIFLTTVDNWINSLPMNKKITITEKIEFNRLKKELIARLKVLWQQYDINTLIIKEEIKNNLLKFPIDASMKRNQKFVSDKVDELLKLLLDIASNIHQLSSISEPGSSASNKQVPKKAADILYDSIANWCEYLPIPNGNTLEDKERTKTLKQHIASKLINKVGEININPEIFNNSMLYEDVIQDEIDNLLSTLPPSQELENTKSEINRNLLEKITEAREKTLEELAGKAYLHQLREAISNTLPSFDLSSEEQASFEMLKDSLADAYINLHHIAESDGLKQELKNRIAKEINRFCNNYLKRHPATPIDPTKINQDLLNALQKVPIPRDETMKSEIQQVRLKGVVNDWIKELPLLQASGPELLKRNKIVTILAKRLHDIEKEQEVNPDINHEDKTQKEIKKWLMKLPLISDKKMEIEDMVNNLRSKLQSAELSRNVGPSLATTDPNEKSSDTSQKTSICHLCPLSTLSTEDKIYMQRIRERNFTPSRFEFSASSNRKDAAVDPLSIDIGSQTEMRPNNSELSDSKNIVPTCSKILNTLPHTISTSCDRPCVQEVGSQVEIFPQIIVKEYFWNTSATQCSEYRFPCSTHLEPCSSFQSHGLPCTSTSQGPPSIPDKVSWTTGQNRFLSPVPCIVLPPPSIPKAPCVSIQQQTSSCQSQHACLAQQPDISIRSTPKRLCTRKERSVPFSQLCFKSTDASKNSSPIENPEVGTSRSFRQEHMSRPDSFEDIQYSKSSKNHDKTQRSKGVPNISDDNENTEWSARFPDDVEFWDSSSSRGRIYQIPSEDIEYPFTRERKRKQEKVRCRCKERILTKSMSRKVKQTPCQSCENLRRCTKCSGIHCPHPSGFYFR
ncbi:uncharacterized protein LOC131852272 [Achroia grisella]|uniref:uncharacterized protein LOC131852272 n=1 Tax=Achroia grisella TaxID=688607 RepID=UPI0027D2C0F9|nr:uncharacterized protein LOC131852272 [Achroia grisella]